MESWPGNLSAPMRNGRAVTEPRPIFAQPQKHRHQTRLLAIVALALWLAIDPVPLTFGQPTYQRLKSFGKPSVGGYPTAGLIQGRDGALYGTAAGLGNNFSGTVFKLNPDGTSFTVLKHLDRSTTGSHPYGRLMQGADGALYGTANDDGSGHFGTVFKLNPDGSGFTVIKNFDYWTGANPYAGLIQGTDGALYGTTSSGGNKGHGTVFRLNRDGTGFAVLKNFDYYTIGSLRAGGELMQGMDGALYGIISEGSGGVFKLNVDGSGFTVLKTGVVSYAGLTQGTDGALYGTTDSGGSSGYGTVFKLKPDGSGFSVLKNFDDPVTSAYPKAGLIQGTDGALYGTANVGGGSGGGGTLFKLNPDGTGFTVLLNFDWSTTGAYPCGGLMQGADGALYGTASTGGSSGGGTVFKLNPDGTGFTVLLNFDSGTTGAVPSGSLLQGSDGNLYGTTYEGGDANLGTVFRLVVVAQIANLPPTIACPSDIVKQTDPAQCSAVVTYAVTVNANRSGVKVVCTPPSGSVFPKGKTTVVCKATGEAGNIATCSFTVTVVDREPPRIVCPADITLPCSMELLVPATFAATATDNCDSAPTITYSKPSGSGFPVGTTTVVCTATDSSGNKSSCSFTVRRAPLEFSGFLAPIGGADATGGSNGAPLRTFKLSSTIPVKFTAACGGTAVTTGIHTLKAIRRTSATIPDATIDASPTDAATRGNQFRSVNGQWQFNLDTKATGMTTGQWELVATMSDGSEHNVWIQLK